jgi:hypothetical protein
MKASLFPFHRLKKINSTVSWLKGCNWKVTNLLMKKEWFFV